jgi:hypothetical protein
MICFDALPSHKWLGYFQGLGDGKKSPVFRGSGELDEAREHVINIGAGLSAGFFPAIEVRLGEKEGKVNCGGRAEWGTA